MGWEEEGRQHLKVREYARGPYQMGSFSGDSRSRIAGKSGPGSGSLMSAEANETGGPELGAAGSAEPEGVAGAAGTLWAVRGTRGLPE